jgi:hypothetical protein
LCAGSPFVDRWIAQRDMHAHDEHVRDAIHKLEASRVGVAANEAKNRPIKFG